MPIRRRQVLGGMLEGLGQGLENFGKLRIQRKNLDAQRQFELDKNRQVFGESLLTKILANPDQADQLIALGRQNGVDLNLLTPTAGQRTAPLTNAINAAKSPLDLPVDPVGQLLSKGFSSAPNALGLDTGRPMSIAPGTSAMASPSQPDTPRGAVNMPPQMWLSREGSTTLLPEEVTAKDSSFMTLPSTQYGPGTGRTVSTITDLIAKKQAAMDAEDKAKVVQATALNRGGAYGTVMGTAAATHESAPTTLADQLAALTAKGPVEAQNAGLTSTAQFDAVHTPDRMQKVGAEAGLTTAAQIAAGLTPEVLQGRAKEAGMVTAAQEAARNRAAETKPIVAIEFGTPAYKVAQDLAYGKMPATTFRTLMAYSRDAGQKLAIYAKAGELNPNFNPAAFEMGFKLASNPKVQQQLASLDNVIQAAPSLLEASDQAKRSGVTFLNQYTNPIKVGIGNKQFSNLKTAQIAFADELSGALGYGSATDMSRQMGFNMTDPRLSPENFQSAIQTIVLPFVDRKRATLLNQMGIYGGSEFNPAANAPKPSTAVPPGSTSPSDVVRQRGRGGR